MQIAEPMRAIARPVRAGLSVGRPHKVAIIRVLIFRLSAVCFVFDEFDPRSEPARWKESNRVCHFIVSSPAREKAEAQIFLSAAGFGPLFCTAARSTVRMIRSNSTVGLNAAAAACSDSALFSEELKMARRVI
jgi:hypothetical protein